jgi:hypothetical protein
MVSAAVAPGFLEALADHIRDLADAVKADPRSSRTE